MNRLKFIFCLTFLGVTSLTACFAQNVFHKDTIFNQLIIKILRGEKRALRDLGSFLDDKQKSQEALLLLRSYTFFSDDLIDLDKKTSRDEFFRFYYNNSKEITFSYLFNAFFIRNFDKKKVDFKVKIADNESNRRFGKVKDLTSKMEQFIVAEKADSALKILYKLQENAGPETYKFLTQLAKDKRIHSSRNFRASRFLQQLCDALTVYPSQESLNIIFHLIDNQHIAPALTALSLARITNVFSAHEGTDAQLSSRYKKYLDSLKTLDAMRTFGYARYDRFQRNYFDEDVDYFAAFATTAAESDNYWWIKANALTDMVKSHHPRVLYYLAAQFYKERNERQNFGFDEKYFFETLQSQTNERISVQDSLGNWTERPRDIMAKKNFLLYWSQHWNDYEWDDYLAIFVNKQQKLAQKENYERLFRRLTSTNDSVAVWSYRELSDGEPSEIMKLNAKYRSLLRNVNSNVPNFKSKILDNLSLFTEYCRNQKISYQPSTKDLVFFNSLLASMPPNQRYLLENEFIEKLTLEQVTKFEYWAILHESLPFVNYSASRILDKWYAGHWREIFSNDKDFRLFLKKTALFARFGVVGTCNNYAKKINSQDENIKNYLQTYLNMEADTDITTLCQSLLYPPTEPEKTSKIAVSNSETTNLKSILQNLENESIATIENINFVTQSTAYKPEYREICLKSLSKIQEINEVFSLKIQPRLSSKNGDLAYMANLKLGYKDLDDLPRIFELDDVEKMFAFMSERATNFNVDEAGAFYNNLFRATWFSNFLNGGLFKKEDAEKIKAILERYLSESELISEFEEQATQRNIAQLDNIGRPLLQKLEAAKNNSADEETRNKILTEIIARVNYDELHIVVPFMAQMSPIAGRSPLTFLSEDFGLPVFELKNQEEIDDFVKKHQKMSELEFYKNHLQKFGLDFLKKDGNLDFAKIYTILKYDLVTPFSGSGGVKRDYYVYGLIKLLELKFVTRLNFHYKLNENQTFYSYNSTKRVEAWLKYLLENKIYRPDNEEIRGFNQ